MVDRFDVYMFQTVKYEVKEKTVRYFVHYNGWNKRYVGLKSIDLLYLFCQFY